MASAIFIIARDRQETTKALRSTNFLIRIIRYARQTPCMAREDFMKKKNKHKNKRRKHDSFFRWLFADTYHAITLLELAGKVSRDIAEFLATVNLDTLVRIPDSYSEVDDSGEGDLAFRVSVLTGAPVLVGILLEHKSGHDPNIFNQIVRYARSVMKIHDGNRIYNGLPTMAIIFYNGRESWNPLKKLEEGYPDYYKGSILPFRCSFVNMRDISDSDCFASEDVATGMGVVAMKYAFDKEKLFNALSQFDEPLSRMAPEEASCLLQKINVYLYEYFGKDIFKELDMAFVSIGQKYGFESAGDYFRKQIADARKETEIERQKAEAERREMVAAMLAEGDSVEKVVRISKLSESEVLSIKASLATQAAQ